MNKLTVAQAVEKIKDLTGHARFVGEFYGTDDKSGIWFSGESTVSTKIEGMFFDLPVLDTYGEYKSYYGGNLHPRIKDILDRAGLYMELYDSGTCMAYT